MVPTSAPLCDSCATATASECCAVTVKMAACSGARRQGHHAPGFSAVCKSWSPELTMTCRPARQA
jgi:hypothetical protein